VIHADAHRGVAIGAVGLLPERLGVEAPPLGAVHRRVVDGRVAGRRAELLVAILLLAPVQADGLRVGAAGALPRRAVRRSPRGPSGRGAG
jgi:hypothetical protein